MTLWWIYPVMAAAGAIYAAASWTRTRRQQRRTARVQQQRAQRIAEIQARLDQCHIDDAELADALARWSDDMNKQQREEG